MQFKAVDSIPIFQSIFGFVWKCLEIFDLDGHNLGTVAFARDPFADSIPTKYFSLHGLSL